MTLKTSVQKDQATFWKFEKKNQIQMFRLRLKVRPITGVYMRSIVLLVHVAGLKGWKNYFTFNSPLVERDPFWNTMYDLELYFLRTNKKMMVVVHLTLPFNLISRLKLYFMHLLHRLIPVLSITYMNCTDTATAFHKLDIYSQKPNAI